MHPTHVQKKKTVNNAIKTLWALLALLSLVDKSA